MVIRTRKIDGVDYVDCRSVKAAIDGLVHAFTPKPLVSYKSFEVLVGPTTTCKIEFTGPVGVEEFDSILAHLAYYKKTIVSTDPIEQKSMRDEVMDAISQYLPLPSKEG